MAISVYLIASALVLSPLLYSFVHVVIRRASRPITSAGVVSLALAFVLMGTGCGGAELLQNGDFESGDEPGEPVGWNITWWKNQRGRSKAERVPAAGRATGEYALALTRPPANIAAKQDVDLSGRDVRGFVVEGAIVGVASAPDELILDVTAFYGDRRQRLSRVSHPGDGQWTKVKSSSRISAGRSPDALRFSIVRQRKSAEEVLIDNATLRIRRQSFFRDKVPPSSVDLVVSFVCASVLVVLMTVFFRKVWTKDSRVRSACINGLVLVVTLLYLVLGSESFVRMFLIQSDGTAQTLVSRLWWSRYWHPLNSYGYRDVEHDEADVAGRKVLFTVGDSYTAGHGVKDVKDVYARVLQKELGEEWRVVNISKCGWATRDEYQAAVSFPYKPDVIVPAYALNDIQIAASEHGVNRPPLHAPSRAVRSLIDRSYFMDFAYWRVFVLAHRSEIWRKFVSQCYEYDDIWRTHGEDLDSFVRWTRDENAKLVVAVFPWLNNVAASERLTAKVAAFFEARDIPVIDLAGVFADRKPSQLVVNGFDAHPNESVHKEVAGLLLDMILND